MVLCMSQNRRRECELFTNTWKWCGLIAGLDRWIHTSIPPVRTVDGTLDNRVDFGCWMYGIPGWGYNIRNQMEILFYFEIFLNYKTVAYDNLRNVVVSTLVRLHINCCVNVVSSTDLIHLELWNGETPATADQWKNGSSAPGYPPVPRLRKITFITGFSSFHYWWFLGFI